MVVSSILYHAVFGQNDRRENAPTLVKNSCCRKFHYKIMVPGLVEFPYSNLSVSGFQRYQPTTFYVLNYNVLKLPP